MFSIVIPLHNKEQSITNTLQSVLNQSFTEFEVIIVNDGSTDKSVEKVEAFTDPRIRLIHQVNAGVSAARNKGIEEARFEWIAFLDADDLWKEKHLETFKQNIETYTDISVFVNGFAYMINEKVKTIQNIETGIIDNYFKLVINNPLIHTSAICIRKTVLTIIGGFHKEITHGEDLEMWARIGKKYKMYYSKIINVFYVRGIKGQATGKMPRVEKSIVSHLTFDVYDNVFEINYYRKIVLSRFFSYLKRRKVHYSLQIYRKYKKYISPIEYILYLKSKLK